MGCKHGLLSRRILIPEEASKEGYEECPLLLESPRQDLPPVGGLEELLVEKIAVEYWRLKENNLM